MKISIVIPVYNESKTIITVLNNIKKLIENNPHAFQIIIVNDGSTDNTDVLIQKEKNLYNEYIKLEKNSGKGSALKEGFKKCDGDITIIQDADLEYNPNDYEKLIEPFLKYNADVVYGSRFKSSETNRVLFFWHSVANKIITIFSNIFSDLNLTDVETGYKVFRTSMLKNLNIEEKSFGIEIELTHKIANIKPQPKIYEVGISYNGRTYSEGKKIGPKDAFFALYCILKYGFIKKFFS